MSKQSKVLNDPQGAVDVRCILTQLLQVSWTAQARLLDDELESCRT
jgi:hypothetical protein